MIKKSVLIVVGLSVMLAIRLESTSPDIPYPIELRLEPVPMPSVAGPVNLKVSIISNRTCEGATLAVTGIDNLEYAGDTQWNLSFNQSDTTALNLKLIIPENDTSGIGLTCSCSVYGNLRWEAYFISDSSKVSFHYANPRRVSRTLKGVPIDMSDPPKSDEIGEDRGTIWYEDEDGNLVPIDSIVNGLSPSGKRVGTIDQNGNFIPLDSLQKISSEATADSSRPVVAPGDGSKVWTHDSEGNQIRVDRDSLINAIKDKKIRGEYENMLQLEQTPLTEFDKQGIKVDGKTYIRSRGEYKFHPVESTADPTKHSEQYRDQINIAKGKVFEFNFDLRDPMHLEYAKSKIDNLAPTDSAGFYRATIDWQTVLDFKEKGMVFRKIGWKPREDTEEPGMNAKPEKKKQ